MAASRRSGPPRRRAAIEGLAGLALAAWFAAPVPAEAQAPNCAVIVTGANEPDLLARLDRLATIRVRPVDLEIEGALDARLAADAERVARAMRALGYHDVVVQTAADPGPPCRAAIGVTAGRRYVIGEVDLHYAPPIPDAPPTPPISGEPATGRLIVDAAAGAVDALRDRGRYDAKLVTRRALLDRPRKAIDLEIEIAPGPMVTAGDMEVEGLERLNAARVARLSKIEPGELVTPALLDEAERDLIASALFDRATVEPVGSAAERTLRIAVDERLPRTLSGALRFATDTGFAAEATWEHRNLFGDAERVRATLTVGQTVQALEGEYRAYDWPFFGQSFRAAADVRREEVDGQLTSRAATFAGLEWPILDELTFRYGLSAEVVRDETEGRKEDYALAGLPLELVYDAADDPLDPSEGFRATLRITPYSAFREGTQGFVVTEAIGAAYMPFDEAKMWVAAARARLGTISGAADADAVPYAKRFFAGGGGSIRGFAFRRAGPLDAEDRPIGGASVAEINAEIRWRAFEDIAVVAFVDAGGAFRGQAPGQDGDWFVGAGLGARYYTAIGPIRLDVAAPLNAREGEPAVQVYVSIGQAF